MIFQIAILMIVLLLTPFASAQFAKGMEKGNQASNNTMSAYNNAAANKERKLAEARREKYAREQQRTGAVDYINLHYRGLLELRVSELNQQLSDQD